MPIYLVVYRTWKDPNRLGIELLTVREQDAKFICAVKQKENPQHSYKVIPAECNLDTEQVLANWAN